MKQDSVKTNILNDLSNRSYYMFKVLIWSWHTGCICVIENSVKKMFCLPIRSIPIFALCIDFMSIQIFCVKVMLNDPVFYEGRMAHSWENICFLWTTSVVHTSFKQVSIRCGKCPLICYSSLQSCNKLIFSIIFLIHLYTKKCMTNILFCLTI